MSIIQNKINFLDKNRDKEKYWNITYTQGVFISNLVAIKKPKYILEIGTSNAFSTLFLLKEISDDSLLYTIEVNEARYNEAKNNLRGIDNVVCLLGEVFEILETYDFEIQFDFIFIDAAQKFYKNLIEIMEKKNLIAKNAIIVADNVLSHN
ncbi:methyltransferase domain-containing protein, partial [bacterium]|nr:methyltransferase domain-containing protein [bacterium]